MESQKGDGTVHFLQYSLPEASAHTNILIGKGLLTRVADYLHAYAQAQILLVCDTAVADLYAVPLHRQLKQHNYRAHLLTIPGREDAKTLNTVNSLYDRCYELQIERNDVVVAVGGGVTGDIAGMLAGTYLRGLEFVQIPTTLVAMVSASVGGKAGVNYRDHKNLVGVFKHPAWILADTDTLASLPRQEFLSGLGELLTVGVLGAPHIFTSLEEKGPADLPNLIVEAIQCKCSIVEADPMDRLGIRAKLNLGHTFGHALEKLSDFTLPHGLAVAVGLRIASRLAVALGLCPKVLEQRIRQVLVGLNLPAGLSGYHPEGVMHAMLKDKKRAGGRIQWVLPTDLGKVTLVSEDQVPLRLLEQLLTEIVWKGTN